MLRSMQTEAMQVGDNGSLTVEPVAGSMGARVRGLRLDRLSDAQFQDLQRAIHDFKAVMVLDQGEMEWEGYVRFGERFGELAVDPFVDGGIQGFPEIMSLIKDADERGYNFGGTWHTDGSYLERPGAYTILWGREVPPFGGDTAFANLEMAYETLSDGLKQTLLGLRVLHETRGPKARTRLPRPGDYAVSFGVEDDDTDVIKALHPALRKHNHTGRTSLFINPVYCIEFEGWSEEESRGLLRHLSEHALRPAFTARMRWEPGAVMIWDNRSTMHYAIGDYYGYRRAMYRLAVKGDAVLPADAI